MNAIDRRFYGVASGFLGTMRAVGQVISMGITMIVFNLHFRRTMIRPENYMLLESMKVAFAVFTVLCVVGTVISIIRGQNKK